MFSKRVICPERVRKIPSQFSWIDHRLVRDRYIERCNAPAALLYLFLLTVADAQGLSYYGDTSLSRWLSLDPDCLRRARDDLTRLGLIAYERPLYQVLGLDSPALCSTRAQGKKELQAMLSQLREGREKHRGES